MQIKTGVWPGTGFEWQMVSTISIQIFRLEILDYLSRHSVYFGKFPFGQTKTVFHSNQNFRNFLLIGKQPLFGSNFGHITIEVAMKYAYPLRECMVTHAHNIHHSKSKMANISKGRRILDFSTLRHRNKSKVRKQRTGWSAIPRLQQGSVSARGRCSNTVTDDEVEVDVCDGLHEQPLLTACEAVSDDQSIIQEYVLLLCQYDGVTMIDHRRFCLPQFNSGQHKLMGGNYEMNVSLGTSVITGQDFNEGHKCILMVTNVINNCW